MEEGLLMAKREQLTPDMTGKEQLKPEKTALKKGSLHSKPASQSVTGPSKEETGFHVAGIGASAGGLEVFEEFFTHLPHGNGIAFVLITHLNPSHMSILPDLIKKYTRMQVYQIEDGMEVKPDCVYVTPPNKNVAILNGTLQLMEPPEPRGLRLPIDYFFRFRKIILKNI
jgi:two-component system CheB/CheR fusion protein